MEVLFWIYVGVGISVFLLSLAGACILVAEHRSNGLSTSERDWLKIWAVGIPASFVWPLVLPAFVIYGGIWLFRGIVDAWDR